ncbi:MAG: hypothetical protein CGW95_03460 [Phenylobacterium zucineum]|nr:MAG: hypothetical protein CGW95_03460 [Phenylobacterium zucineum]
MRQLTRTALALALLASTAGLARAQDDRDHGDREDRRIEARGEPKPGVREAAPPPASRPVQEVPTMGGWQRDAEGHTWRGVPQGRLDPPPAPPAPSALQAPVPQAPVIAPRPGDRMVGRMSPDGREDPGIIRDESRLWSGRDRPDPRRQRGDEDRREARRGWDRDDRYHDDHRWRNPNRYRGWDYRPPNGYYARTWIFGDLLPRTWWLPDDRITQWWNYGLPRPPLGSEWVRVGDDALLIDRITGRVFQVIYDLFW